jgi:organic radical activating enzyme
MNVEKPDSSTDPNFVNAQPPERESTTPYELGVHSTFVTIQGEGPCTGQKALFIRLAGCNLQCPKCDTDYTSHREFWTDEAFVHNTIVKHPDVDLYVITGGEPLRQTAALINCIERLDSYLIKERRAIRIQIETNGVYSPFLDNFCNVDVIYVVSPKTSHITHDDTELFDFWKYVMSADGVCGIDGLPTRVLGQCIRPHRPTEWIMESNRRRVFLQPEDSKDPETNRRNMEACVQSCMKYGYTLCLQIQKIVGLP